MGRPAVHSVDDFIDAAAALFGSGGGGALTMTATARHVGAPSGSIYHRFADRPALLAALWLRTTSRFTDGYFEALGEFPTPDSAETAAVWGVRFCRNNLAQAQVLQAGVAMFSPETWSTEARRTLSDAEATIEGRIASATRALHAHTALPREDIVFALVDLPMAAVRRHLLAGEAPPPRVDRLVRRLTRRCLVPDVSTP